MFAQIKPGIRQAGVKDRNRLASLVHFEFFVHRHLDWRDPLDWLDHQPFLILERRDKPLGALGCPPDPPGIAWIHLFTTASGNRPDQVWAHLWPAALNILRTDPAPLTVAALPTQSWFKEILEASQFQLTHQVIHLAWHRNSTSSPSLAEPGLPLRPMNAGDIPAVAVLDAATFPLLWQNSFGALQCAFHEAAVATVVEDGEKLVGYQISTATSAGGHLARLAVHPDYQCQGIATTLVSDLIHQFERRGAEVVSVNTQNNNAASLALYTKLGFRLTGDRHPVYEFAVSG